MAISICFCYRYENTYYRRQTMRFNSPLRYPGGKGKLLPFFKIIIKHNDLNNCHYIEPFAGGCGLALSLLFLEYASHIHINDLNPSVYAFWESILNHTEEISRLIEDTPVTMEEWEKQKAIQDQNDVSIVEKGFSTFFLNRTNRSGILGAGVIGGKKQNGKWKLDSRYNKSNLIARIQQVALYKNRISLYNMDAMDFLNIKLPDMDTNTLAYLDPPYFVKGQGLYDNFYNPEDHEKLAQMIKQINTIKWIVSYDNAKPIQTLYKDCKSITYDLHYSACIRYEGSEFMAFSKDLKLPEEPQIFKNIKCMHNMEIAGF